MTATAYQQALREFLSERPEWRAYLPAISLSAEQSAVENPLSTGPVDEIVKHLPDVADLGGADTRHLVRLALAASGALRWFSTYRADDIRVGRGKVARTAVATLAGPGGVFSARHAMSGLFFVREGVEYAAHSHEADEIYVLLAGTGHFWREDLGWYIARPGDVMENGSWIQHAMMSAEQPLLIAWAHVGEGVGDKALLHSDDGSLPDGGPTAKECA